jgi:hypothetical protein
MKHDGQTIIFGTFRRNGSNTPIAPKCSVSVSKIENRASMTVGYGMNLVQNLNILRVNGKFPLRNDRFECRFLAHHHILSRLSVDFGIVRGKTFCCVVGKVVVL